ncbi:iron ABC transporter permease [bacterium]|nr:iron ABC transporter permease [bacterium]
MSRVTPARFIAVVGAFLLVAIAAMAVAPFIGSETIHPAAAMREWLRNPDARSVDVDILIYIRLPRILAGMLAGAALAMVGALFQALLRNPLATPYTLGVASGGSFGAVVAIYLPALIPGLALSWGPIGLVQIFAFAGSLFAIVMIYMLARTGGKLSTNELLLAGVTMGLIFSALIMAARYFASPNVLRNMDIWMIGQLTGATWSDIGPLAMLVIPSIIGMLALARPLDQIALGEELAGGRGVNVARLQVGAFFLGSLATGAVVAVAGPIGFVGLLVPHAVRRIVGPGHVLLLPCVMLAGGAFLIVCDTLARSVWHAAELPVGILTALLGGPFFIGLLIRGRRTGKT